MSEEHEVDMAAQKLEDATTKMNVAAQKLDDVAKKMENDDAAKKAEDAANLMMKNIVDFGRYSYDLEEKREQSLINQSSQMVTAFSVFSISIYSLVPVLIGVNGINGNRLWLCVCLVK